MANYRNEDLTRLAKDQQCTLLVPGVCAGGTETTVWCHSPFGVHGKGGALKAHDCYGCFGCRACHDWLDSRTHAGVNREARWDAFMSAMSITALTMWSSGMIAVVKRTSKRRKEEEQAYIRPSKMLPR